MLKIAGVQFSGHVDRAVNVDTAIRLVRQAAGQGARIICLPELFNTMYFCVAGVSKAVFHLMPVENAAPPRPRNPDSITSLTICSPLSSALIAADDAGFAARKAVVKL